MAALAYKVFNVSYSQTNVAMQGPRRTYRAVACAMVLVMPAWLVLSIVVGGR